VIRVVASMVKIQIPVEDYGTRGTRNEARGLFSRVLMRSSTLDHGGGGSGCNVVYNNMV
jgi:hypothetical protein